MIKQYSSSPRTERLLASMEANHWFSSCGQSPPELSCCKQVSAIDWQMVERILRSKASDDFCTDSSNEYRRTIRSTTLYGMDDDRVTRFNNWIGSIRPRTTACGIKAAEMAAKFLTDQGAEACRSQIAWIVMGAAVCSQFDMPDEAMYLQLADVLLRGHIVAGWDGDYPNGSVVLF